MNTSLMRHRHARAGVFTAVLIAVMMALPWGAGADGHRLKRYGEGLTFEYAPEDQRVADRMWPVMVEDRADIMARLGVYPSGVLRVVLTRSAAEFNALHPQLGKSSLGIYLLNQHLIYLRSPRGSSGQWDLRGVLRHELVHGIIDLAIEGSVPRWLNEGLALLIAENLSFLDDARLNLAAVAGRLIPLSRLVHGFPLDHGGRTLAYSQAASFSRYLLAQGGMDGFRDLVARLSRGVLPELAFPQVYGTTLAELEARWVRERYGAFSLLGVITGSSFLGLAAFPLLLVGGVRRWISSRRRLREMDIEDGASEAIDAETGHGISATGKPGKPDWAPAESPQESGGNGFPPRR